MMSVRRLLSSISARPDLAFLGLLMLTVVVMIVPIPPHLLDVLIAVNLTLTISILLVAVYLDKATSFSTFPAVILLATTFRLAISIATTRSVLAEADGGEIVSTFGQFATSGNIAIGVVIFLIISIVQFVVITKGAERVAEVAARFVLDALPGRQMSIDAELRAGSIDQEEARARRAQIDQENQFFGAMDGAMKFVKGDAITGLLIVAVNLMGGLAIGMAQRGMSFSEAAATYSLLTIGDGLVSQLPALIIAMSAGIIITRVTTSEKTDLGSDIVAEMTRSTRSLVAGGAVIVALGLIPGFPFLIFAVIGVAMIAASMLGIRRRQKAQEAANGEAETKFTSLEPNAGDRIVLHVSKALAAQLDGKVFSLAQAEQRAEFSEKSGIDLPQFGVAVEAEFPDDRVTVELDGVPLADAQLAPGLILAIAEPRLLDVAALNHWDAGRIGGDRSHVRLVAKADAARLDEASIPHLGAEDLLNAFVISVVSRHGASFIGFDVVQGMMRRLRQEYPEIADQISATVANARVLEILRRLAEERVPLKPLRRLAEAIAEWAPRYTDPDVIAECVRRSLSAQICFAVADKERNIAAYLLEPELEDALRKSLRQTDTGEQLTMPAAQASALLQEVARMRAPLDPHAPAAVLICSPDLRRHIRGYLARHDVDVPLLSFWEIAREFRVHVIGTLGTPSDEPAQVAA